MITTKYKRKKCACGYFGFFIGKSCNTCQVKKWKNNAAKKYKPTGEKAIFEEIWNERPHRSYVSGKPIKSFSVANFSHILSKKQFPRFRLNKDNIVLKTFEEHQKWEFEKYKLKDLPEWQKIFELEEKLKQQYGKTSKDI